ncbi:MAG: ATPase [Oscillospiraceae bacterium]|nr:ATPase [Oscillospiraceae bacterium]MCR5805967.1 ATPase [Oscillospiraceae bacterium]
MAEELIEVILDQMTDSILKAKSIPLTQYKALDHDFILDCIDNIRMNLPDEIKQAKKIVNERKAIIDDAKKNAEEVITRAESRARELTETSMITKAAQNRAAEIEKKANENSKAVKAAAENYVVDMLTRTEKILAANVDAVSRAKNAIAPAKEGTDSGV